MVAVAVEFAAKPGDPWRAITCQVFGAGWSRGAPDDRGPLTIAEAGQASVYLIDPDRDLDPENDASPFAGEIDVGVPFRISLGAGVAFTGRIDGIVHTLDPDRLIPLARIDAVDVIAKLAQVEDDWPALPAESSSDRITRILTAAQVTTVDVQAGGLQLQAHPAEHADAWSLIVDVVQNELGSIEVRPDGTVTYRTRRTAWAPTAATLHVGCGAGALPLAGASLEQNRSSIRNRVAAGRVGGSVVFVGYDATSVAKHGLRSMSRTDLELTSDTAAALWGGFVHRRSVAPTRAYRELVVPNVTAAEVAALEAAILFTTRVHVTIDEWGEPIDATLRLLGIAWDVSEDASANATLVLGTDWPLLPVAREATYDSDGQWSAGLGAGSGVLNWEVVSGALRVAATPDASGGVGSFVLSWSASG